MPRLVLVHVAERSRALHAMVEALRLPGEADLQEVGADAYFPVALPACAQLERATINQVRERLIAGGHATAGEIDRHLANLAAGRLDLATCPMITAWGRRR